MSEENIYRDLQRHLDKQPIGFPETKTGSDIRLLKHFFSPDEAIIILKLNTKYKSNEEVHKLIRNDKVSIEKLKIILDKMVKEILVGEKEMGLIITELSLW